MAEERHSQLDEGYHERNIFDYELENEEFLVVDQSKITYRYNNKLVGEVKRVSLKISEFRPISEGNMFRFIFNDNEDIKIILGIVNYENYKLFEHEEQAGNFSYYKFKFYEDENIESYTFVDNEKMSYTTFDGSQKIVYEDDKSIVLQEEKYTELEKFVKKYFDL